MRKLSFWLALGLFIFQICLAALPSLFFGWGNLGFATFFQLNLSFDSLSRVLLLCIGMVMSTSLFTAKYTIKDDSHLFNFINLMLLALAGMNGMVMVKDIFSLYVFLEIAAVASFILIASDKDIDALEGAFKYILLSAVASVLMITSIALLVLVSGSTDFSTISGVLKLSHSLIIKIAIGVFICAAFIKAGVMPFHGWLPDAYSSAPMPVSVLLAGVVTKTVGVYTLIRIVVSVFGFDGSIKAILLLAGAASIILAALAALGQSDFKRMLAYSSISQVGYMILGLGCGTTLGVAGAIFHLFNHSVFKSLLFVNAAAVETQTGLRDMDKMSGLSKKMPVTGTTSVLASLSTAGIPPLAGFWSKLIIIIALWIAGYKAYAIIAVLGSVLTLAYFLSMQRRVFFGKLGEEFSAIKEAGFNLALPAVILAVIIVGVGVFFPFLINTFILPTAGILGG